MDKRICLVIPPAAFLLSQRVFVYLGILKVAAVLEKAGWRVEMLDLSGISNFKDVAVEHAKSSKSKILDPTISLPSSGTSIGPIFLPYSFALASPYGTGKSYVPSMTLTGVDV